MSKLTVKELEALRASDQGKTLREDNGLIGAVWARSKGVSVKWEWRYRFNGKVRQTTLGTWPALTMPAIRSERDRLAAIVHEGRDPAEEKRAARLKARADQAEAINVQESRISEIEAQSARMTVRSLFERWERLELKNRKDKGAEVRRSFEKDVLPLIGDMAAEEVKRGTIAACLDAVVECGAPIIARNLLGDLRQMFGDAIKRSFVENDPTSV